MPHLPVEFATDLYVYGDGRTSNARRVRLEAIGMPLWSPRALQEHQPVSDCV